ncbi:MAG TPA: ROK family protein [Puia sp.]|nr:ROK family protein [Puia sp.]
MDNSAIIAKMFSIEKICFVPVALLRGNSFVFCFTNEIVYMLLGFDIGGTKCAVVIGSRTNTDGIRIADKVVLPTNLGANEMISSLFTNAELLIEKNGFNSQHIEGIGISCGGPLNSKTGMILSPPNLPGWDNISIVEMAEKKFGKKTLLQNDANACAVAEWKFGAGKGYNNIIFLTFGTGMGAGLILDGKLYSGTNDLAGEVGHLRLADNGPVGFGKAGSFEGFCSGGGITQLAQMMAREKLQMGEKVSFCKCIDELHLLTARSVAEAAYKGDELARNIYKVSSYYLGKALSLLIDVLNPELIILGSIYTRSQSLIEPYMHEVIAKESILSSYQHCRIVPAALGENIGDMAALALADAIAM